MLKQLPPRLRSAAYSLRGGFLIRPLAIAIIPGLCGAVLSSVEEASSAAGWLPVTVFPSRDDPVVAQTILSVIATSIMTVVSIVFAMLLMTFTLTSMQFSPRILISFVRDRGTQWTLGIFLGTFCYCVAALPAARALPHPFAPVVTVAGAMLLALICVGWLVFFIHHISHPISVNHIVDRIARETEQVIDQLIPDPRGPHFRPSPAPFVSDEPKFPMLNEVSGYIRFIDTKRLLRFAQTWHLRTRTCHSRGRSFRPVGRAVAHDLPPRPPRSRSCGGTDRSVRYRTDAHAAAGRRVRCHSDRRYRGTGNFTGGQRSQHGNRLHRPPHSHPDLLDQPLPA